jgi:hypothetical protein
MGDGYVALMGDGRFALPAAQTKGAGGGGDGGNQRLQPRLPPCKTKRNDEGMDEEWRDGQVHSSELDAPNS